MEYHNYNTPLDRINDDFVKQILSGEFDPSCGCERGCEDTENRNSDCSSRTGASKTCRYNRRYSRCGNSCFNGGIDSRRNERSNGCNYRTTRREETPCENASFDGGESETVCGCGDCTGFTSPTLHGVPHSMVYSPHQHFEGLYECDEALDRGTIFRCLDFPFGPTACRVGRCNNENEGCR